MLFGFIGLAILGCIMYDLLWVIPFLIILTEILTGFSGSMVQWFSSMGDD